MNSDAVKNFYNKHFFQDRRPKDALCGLTIRCGSEEITIPAIYLHPRHTIESIFHAWHKFLNDGGVPAVPAQEAPTTESEAPAPEGGGEAEEVQLPINVEQVKYRNYHYLVEHYHKDDQDEYIIKNRDKEMKVIPLSSPTAKGVLKRYRELLK